MENFTQESKNNAAVLAARYLMNNQSVSGYSRMTHITEIVTDKFGNEYYKSRCERDYIIGRHVQLITHEYWSQCAVALTGYYDMIGLTDVPTPEYRKSVSTIGGSKTAKVEITTVGNPELWCFAPHFHEALTMLQEQEQNCSTVFGGSHNRRTA